MRGTRAIAGATGWTRAIAITTRRARTIAGSARRPGTVAITTRRARAIAIAMRWTRTFTVARRAIATTKLSEPGGEFGFAHRAVVVGVKSSEETLGRARRWAIVFAGSQRGQGGGRGQGEDQEAGAGHGVLRWSGGMGVVVGVGRRVAVYQTMVSLAGVDDGLMTATWESRFADLRQRE
jgi:hypothetical protein